MKTTLSRTTKKRLFKSKRKKQLLLLTSNISFKYYHFINISIINRAYIKARVL